MKHVPSLRKYLRWLKLEQKPLDAGSRKWHGVQKKRNLIHIQYAVRMKHSRKLFKHWWERKHSPQYFWHWCERKDKKSLLRKNTQSYIFAFISYGHRLCLIRFDVSTYLHRFIFLCYFYFCHLHVMPVETVHDLEYEVGLKSS